MFYNVGRFSFSSYLSFETLFVSAAVSRNVQYGSNMNGTIFYERKTPSRKLLTLDGEVFSLSSLSGSCELVQSCLSSTREISEQKVSVSLEQRTVTKLLTAEGIQPPEILQRLEKQFGEACVSRTQVFELC